MLNAYDILEYCMPDFNTISKHRANAYLLFAQAIHYQLNNELLFSNPLFVTSSGSPFIDPELPDSATIEYINSRATDEPFDEEAVASVEEMLSIFEEYSDLDLLLLSRDNAVSDFALESDTKEVTIEALQQFSIAGFTRPAESLYKAVYVSQNNQVVVVVMYAGSEEEVEHEIDAVHIFSIEEVADPRLQPISVSFNIT